MARARPVLSPLDKVAADVAAEYGGTPMKRASQATGYCHLETGVFILDYALLGGVPEGMVTMFYGWERSGKSTLALRAIAAAQRKYGDKTPVLIEPEGTFDPIWAQMNGVDLDRLMLAQPENGEQCVDIMAAVLETSDTSLVVMDSIAGMNPTKELEDSAGDANVALLARLTGKLCSKTTAGILKQRADGHLPSAIFINQFRYKIGVKFGDPRTLPGGVQQNYTAVVKVETKMKKEHQGVDSHGMPMVSHTDHGFEVKKSKAGSSLREGEYRLVGNPESAYGAGFIDDGATVVSYGKAMGFIGGPAGKYTVDGILPGTHRTFDDIVAALYENPVAFNVLKRGIIQARREANGKPVTPDGYLLGYPEDDVLEDGVWHSK